MKRYAEYKDSGVKWLGKIPSHWEVKRFPSIAKLVSITGHTDEELLSVFLDSGVIKTKDSNGKQVHKPSEDMSNYQLVQVGNFVMNNQQCWRGSVGVSPYKGIISPAYHIFELSEELHRIYANYLLRDKAMVTQYRIASKGVGSIQQILSFPWLRSVRCIIPPYSEQAQITNYLKVKTSKIDKYVTKRERERERFESLKQAEIANVVTKGLNPDVPMKDSGIPWLGMIPEHWEVKMLSHLCKEHFVSNKNIHNQNLLSLSYGHIVNKDINTTDGLLPASFDTYQIIESGNIVLRLTDLQNDHKSLRVGLSKQEGIITSAYICLEVMKHVLPDYLYYLLHTADLKKMFYSMGNGLRQNLNWMELRKFRGVLPPLEEQQAIVEYIDSRIEKIDRYIAGLTAEIEYLKEFKQRLISDAVTGQIKVTD